MKTKNNHNIDLDALKHQCPLKTLLKRMHLEKFIQSCCHSPFRKDDKPSWGVYEKDGQQRWKDLGNNDGGDEISFLARSTGLDEKKDFTTLLRIYRHYAQVEGVEANTQSPATSPTKHAKPDMTGFSKGTTNQLIKLAKLRDFHFDAIYTASERGLLVFGEWHRQEVYGLTDKSGRVLELRRLNGELFPPANTKRGLLPERKSHAVKGSSKDWPVGILEASEHPCIALVEGIPDFLAAFQVCVVEDALDRVAPVAMLCANAGIAAEALSAFKDKHVRIFIHNDEAGKKAAEHWTEQLKPYASKFDYVDFSKLQPMDKPVKDLCDFKDTHAANYPTNNEWRLLP